MENEKNEVPGAAGAQTPGSTVAEAPAPENMANAAPASGNVETTAQPVVPNTAAKDPEVVFTDRPGESVVKGMKAPGRKSHKKLIIILLILVVLGAGLAVFLLRDQIWPPKKTAETPVTNTVTETKVNLAELGKSLLITKGGQYTLTGETAYPVRIEGTEDVTLVLDGVKITTTDAAAIANVGSGKMTLMLAENSQNEVRDGGENEEDGCIFSNGPLVIEGSGSIEVYGQQTGGEGIATKSAPMTIAGGKIYVESADDGLNTGGDGGTITIDDGDITIKAGGDGIDSNQDVVINGGFIYVAGSAMGGDAGVDTDAGFVINNGVVIALGSDMLETPMTDSAQQTIAFNLDAAVASGAEVALQTEEGTNIVTFSAMESFKTLLVSAAGLTNGTYVLTVNGEPLSVNGESVFTVDGVVTMVGTTGGFSGPEGGAGVMPGPEER